MAIDVQNNLTGRTMTHKQLCKWLVRNYTHADTNEKAIYKRDDQQNREISEKSATYFRKVRRGSKSEKPASHLIWYICRSIPFNHA